MNGSEEYESHKAAIIREITYSLPEVVLVKEQVRLIKDCLDRIVEGSVENDGQMVHDAWEAIDNPMSYLSAIMQQRANAAHYVVDRRKA